MFITNSAPKIRVLVIHPFSQRTTDFLKAVSRQTDVPVRIRENTQLPRISYLDDHYRLLYSEAEARRVFNAHVEFYKEQLRQALLEGETILLVSGRFHEYTAPFFVSLKDEWQFDPHLVSFDQHYDCFKNQFNAAGLFRFMIDNRMLHPRKLTIVGVRSDFFDMPLYQDAARSLTIEISAAINDPDASGIADWTRTKTKIIAQRSNLPEDTVFAVLAELFKLTLEHLWVKQAGIRTTNNPDEIIDQGYVFVSFDGDLSGGYSLFKDNLSLQRPFERLSKAKIVGAHVCEIEGPESTFDTDTLAHQFIGLFRSS